MLDLGSPPGFCETSWSLFRIPFLSNRKTKSGRSRRDLWRFVLQGDHWICCVSIRRVCKWISWYYRFVFWLFLPFNRHINLCYNKSDQRNGLSIAELGSNSPFISTQRKARKKLLQSFASIKSKFFQETCNTNYEWNGIQNFTAWERDSTNEIGKISPF